MLRDLPVPVLGDAVHHLQLPVSLDASMPRSDRGVPNRERRLHWTGTGPSCRSADVLRQPHLSGGLRSCDARVLAARVLAARERRVATRRSTGAAASVWILRFGTSDAAVVETGLRRMSQGETPIGDGLCDQGGEGGLQERDRRR